MDETTGHSAVDAVLATLSSSAELPLADQVALFGDAHDQLRELLETTEAH